MVEALLREALTNAHIDGIIVESAGTHPDCRGQHANEYSIACMHQHGINLSAHRSRYIGALSLGEYFMIIVAEPKMKEIVCSLAPHAEVLVANESEGGISNPFGKGPEAYSACVEAIKRALPGLIQSISG